MMRVFRSSKANRVVFAVICLMIVLTGAGNLLQGRLGYQNYKGFSVFAPFAILVGALGLALAVLRPHSSSRETKPIAETRTGVARAELPEKSGFGQVRLELPRTPFHGKFRSLRRMDALGNRGVWTEVNDYRGGIA